MVKSPSTESSEIALEHVEQISPEKGAVIRLVFQSVVRLWLNKNLSFLLTSLMPGFGLVRIQA